jgi:hypothetical protein
MNTRPLSSQIRPYGEMVGNRPSLTTAPAAVVDNHW